MRAVLITNPAATTSGGWTRELLLRALQAEFDITVQLTKHRGHAIELARQSRENNVDVVLTLGGDGTINEAINGLLSTDTGDIPLLGTIPAGLANVFPRSLGFAADALQATGQLIEAISTQSVRKISLGKLNDRYFAFNASIGFDAGIIEEVEKQRAEGHRASPSLYFLTGLRHYFETRSQLTAPIRVTTETGEELSNIYMVVIQNTAPWVFVGPVALDFSSTANFHSGLDLIALTSMTPTSLATYIAETAAGIDLSKRSNIVSRSDVTSVTIASSVPVPTQVDGDSLGSFEDITISHFPSALTVLVPPESPV